MDAAPFPSGQRLKSGFAGARHLARCAPRDLGVRPPSKCEAVVIAVVGRNDSSTVYLGVPHEFLERCLPLFREHSPGPSWDRRQLAHLLLRQPPLRILRPLLRHPSPKVIAVGRDESLRHFHIAVLVDMLTKVRQSQVPRALEGVPRPAGKRFEPPTSLRRQGSAPLEPALHDHPSTKWEPRLINVTG